MEDKRGEGYEQAANMSGSCKPPTQEKKNQMPESCFSGQPKVCSIHFVIFSCVNTLLSKMVNEIMIHYDVETGCGLTQ